MDFDLAMTEPCRGCGTRDEEWRDLSRPVKRKEDGRVVYPYPAEPPPYVAEGTKCRGCAERTSVARALAEGNGGNIEPGVTVILRRWNPAIDEAGD
jgi:hypothetical protein